MRVGKKREDESKQKGKHERAIDKMSKGKKDEAREQDIKKEATGHRAR